jgi:prepilin-type N-terminal cleavage/methylation domain-containing protein
MKPHITHAPRIASRRGFTLVELLVTITIMAILAGMVSGALIVTRQSARIGATKATITKLHTIIAAKYESYHTRRVPIDLLGYGTNPGMAAAIKMLAVRDLMRWEIPERVTDLFVVDASGNPTSVRLANPTLSGLNLGGFNYTATTLPAILNAYTARVNGVSPGWANSASRGLASAECLYMIVTMLCGPEARRQFHQSEMGDTNGNGLPEFLDGWGRPIYFLRWAPAFNDSDLQPNLVTDDELNATTPGSEIGAWTSATATARRQYEATNDHDRLDPRQVNMAQPGDSPYVPNGSRLVPLIYSAGSDGEYGIASYPVTGIYVWGEVQLASPPNRIRYFGTDYQSAWGLPVRNAVGDWVHFDNLHNHRVEAE